LFDSFFLAIIPAPSDWKIIQDEKMIPIVSSFPENRTRSSLINIVWIITAVRPFTIKAIITGIL